MTMTARLPWVLITLALALFGLAWGPEAASLTRDGAPKTRAILMELGYASLATLPWRSNTACASVSLPVGKEGVERGRKEIQVAGPVRRASRRTARRTSRRQEIIYD
ncbi:MAG: hypothetical protein WA970_19655 [Gammaproteobacteria bacterium]